MNKPARISPRRRSQFTAAQKISHLYQSNKSNLGEPTQMVTFFWRNPLYFSYGSYTLSGAHAKGRCNLVKVFVEKNVTI